MTLARTMPALRRPLMGAAAAIMAVILSGCAHVSTDAYDEIAVIAHRGGAMLRPENTLPAFRHAAELGAEWIEFDMLMTADDQIVVYHDTTINPAFCAAPAGSEIPPNAPVHELTLAQMQQLDCGAGVRPSYAGDIFVPVSGAKVPTPDEVFGALKDSGARFFVETKIPKDTEIDTVRFAELLNDAVERHGLADRVILQSFDYRTIDALQAINPRVRTCLLGAPTRTDDYLSLLQTHKSTCIVLSDSQIDHSGVQRLQDAGVLVFSGVIDTPQEWQKAVDLGMDAIFTNEPSGALAYLEEADLRP